jgi:hypothetical protein
MHSGLAIRGSHVMMPWAFILQSIVRKTSIVAQELIMRFECVFVPDPDM